MKIAIYGNEYQKDYLALLADFFASLAGNNIRAEIEASFFDYLSSVLPAPPQVCDVIHGDRFTATLALSIGGDGTFLKTAEWVGDKQIPILGINTGHLGYLADVPIGEIDHLPDDIINRRFKIEERSMIEVSTENGSLTGWPYALNEVAILKQDTASMISAKTEINGIALTTYLGDGLIVSTPTGSTGYNLSVGGPIIEPSTPSWVISPIAAHSLTMRPLVVNDSSVIKITTTSRASSFRISLDGRSVSLPAGTVVTLRKAPFPIRVVQRLDHHFSDTLRSKLLWGIDKR
ncbi:MAG: NAD kinase [Muribaculaceae bacterium]|nr:NAD kinase [Muribaculaceae bacterium]